MKKLILALAIPAVLLASCGKTSENADTTQLVALNERLEMAQDGGQRRENRRAQRK